MKFYFLSRKKKEALQGSVHVLVSSQTYKHFSATFHIDERHSEILHIRRDITATKDKRTNFIIIANSRH